MQRGEITLNTLHVHRRHVSLLLNQDQHAHTRSSQLLFFSLSSPCRNLPGAVLSESTTSLLYWLLLTFILRRSSVFARGNEVKTFIYSPPSPHLARHMQMHTMPNLHVFFYFSPLLLGINSMMTQSGLVGNNAHAAERNRWGPGAVCCLCKCAHVSRSTGARQFHCDLDRSHIAQDGCWACQVKRARHSELFWFFFFFFNSPRIHVRFHISGQNILLTGPVSKILYLSYYHINVKPILMVWMPLQHFIVLQIYTFFQLIHGQ